MASRINALVAVLGMSVLAWSAGAQPLVVDASPHTEEVQAPLSAQELARREAARTEAREAIAAQRSAIEVRKVQAEQTCWKRFAVEDCLREVRAQAREQDHVLRERELALNQEERQEKAQQRLRTIAQKQREKPLPAPLAAQAPRTKPAGASIAPQAETDLELLQQQRAEQAKARATDTAARQREQAHEVAERNAEAAQEREMQVQTQQQKLEAAQARRERVQQQAAKRRGQPLPVPEGLPQP